MGRFMACVALFAIQFSFFFSPAAHAHSCSNPSLTPTGTPTANVADPMQDKFYINEVLIDPQTVWNCLDVAPSLSNDSWVEIYNPQSEAFDLSSAHTDLDSGPGSERFHLFNAIIPAHGFLVAFPLTDSHFLMAAKTQLRLLISNTVVDQVALPPMGPDTSYARIPDGTTTWKMTATPTIGSGNLATAVTPTHTPSITRALKTTRATTHSQKIRSTRGQGGAISTASDTAASADNGNDPSTDTADSSTQSDGAQPGWPHLQLPGTDSTPPTSSAQGGRSPISPSSTPPSNEGSTAFSKLLLTTGAMVLALAGYLGWHRYKKRKHV